MSAVVSPGDKADRGTMDSVGSRHRIKHGVLVAGGYNGQALTLVVVEVVSGEGHPQLCRDVGQLVLAAV